MKKILPGIIILASLILACSKVPDVDTRLQYIAEIEKIEHDFMNRVAEKGLKEAFVYYAADEVAIKRGDEVIVGKSALIEHYSKPSNATDVELTWKPDFVDVSLSGDMAYTYGKYTYSFIDSTGVQQEYKGIFHTVWKRQGSGEWKYVFD